MRVWGEEVAGTIKALARVRTRCEHMQREIYGACWRVLRHDIERGRAKMIMEERERDEMARERRGERKRRAKRASARAREKHSCDIRCQHLHTSRVAQMLESDVHSLTPAHFLS